MNVGLEYLALSRSSKSLSGGEAQHPTGNTNWFTGGCFVYFDEPSIGLHQRDNDKLIHSLEQLRDIGNSVVVEHDKDMIERCRLCD
jgi:excinuclease ABC subunit A